MKGTKYIDNFITAQISRIYSKVLNKFEMPRL